MPLVSVIIPAYNPGPYLRVALESVLAQTFTDWELLVIDDGSPQDIAAIAQPFIEKDTRIRVVRQANRGQSIARNVGIMQSSGELLAFLDQDDVWKPTKLEVQVAVMQADNSIGLCHAQFEFIDSEGNWQANGFGQVQTYPEMLTRASICGASSVMVRRECCLAVGLFDPSCQPAEDYDLWLRILCHYPTQFVPSCEVGYRRHDANQTRRYRDTHQAIVTILRKHMHFAQIRGDQVAVAAVHMGLRHFERTFGCQAFDHCRQSFRQHALGSFLNHLQYALRYSPAYVLRSLFHYQVGIRPRSSL